jgi:hypothetical protein
MPTCFNNCAFKVLTLYSASGTLSQATINVLEGTNNPSIGVWLRLVA